MGFNNVFGYYLEVRNTHKDKVPPDWVRKQTLVGAERYITDELKTLEEKILGAEERTLALEQEHLRAVVEEVVQQVGAIRSTALALAEWDVLRAFAVNAIAWKYCRPILNAGHGLDIRDGRHPVIDNNYRRVFPTWPMICSWIRRRDSCS